MIEAMTRSLGASAQHEVVAVHGLLGRARQHLAHRGGLHAHDLPQLGGGVVARSPCRSRRRRRRRAPRPRRPRRTRPATSTIPTGSSDVPPSRSARAAPASTIDRAAGRLGVLQPELEARVAHRLRREARAHRLARPGARQHARLEPAADHGRDARPRSAISAATTFERMPPEPSGEAAWPMSSAASSSRSRRPRARARAPGSDARVGREQPAGVGEQHEQLGARPARRPARRGSRCRRRRSRRWSSCRSR